MSVTLGFDDIQDFEPLESGKVLAEITDVTVETLKAEAKHPEQDYWRIEWTIEEDEYDGEYEGRKLFDNAMLPCPICAEADANDESRPSDHVQRGEKNDQYTPFVLYGVLRASGKYTEEELKSGQVTIDVDDLVGIREVLTVGRQKRNPEYNEIKRREPADTWGDADSSLLT